MADQKIRPIDLPSRSNPVPSEVVPSDNGSTVGAVTWAAGVNAAHPFASQAQAEAGVSADLVMSPLTTKQAITALGSGDVFGPDSSVDRHLAVFGDATGKVIEDGGLAALVTPQGRLSLSSNSPVVAVDVIGATSVYYLPCGGRMAPMWNGSAVVLVDLGAGLTLALDNNSGHTYYQAAGFNFDVFIIDDGGTLRLGTGPAWSVGSVAATPNADVARATGTASSELEVYQGVIVNKNPISVRWGSASGNIIALAARRATYLGTIRTTANGTTEDSIGKRFLFNAFNRTLRALQALEATASWAYSTATYRQANANAANQVEVLFGLAGVMASITQVAQVSTSTTTERGVIHGIGLDSTTQPSGLIGRPVARQTLVSGVAFYKGNPGLGYHRFVSLERGNGTDTQTWWGDTGLIGEVLV